MKFFEGLREDKEIKARYKELAKAHHPDKGGCAETMKAINHQYEQVMRGIYQLAGKSTTEIDELLINDNLMREKLNAILMIEGISIELCGSWVWVTGDTRSCKDWLKSQDFLWAPKKKAWYWRSEVRKCRNRQTMSLDYIREKWGSQAITKRNWLLS